MMRKVAVFFGGKSCENEISVLTGVFVMNLLDPQKYALVPVYIHTDGKAYTSPSMTNLATFKQKKYRDFQRVFFEGGYIYSFQPNKKRIKRISKIDVALNCCHGGLGEGGGVSAMMEWNNIPFASPDLVSSGVFMDKCATKTVMRGLGVPTVDYLRVNERDYKKRGAFLIKSIAGRLKYPVVIKPAHLGSSIGITLAKNETQAKEAIENAFLLDDRVIVEKYLPQKQDVNCAACILRGELCVSEPETAFGEGIYSFEEKYVKKKTDGKPSVDVQKGGGRYALSGELRDKIRAYTRTVYKRMNLQGAVRMDFLVSEGKVYLCEVNTVPGSLAYYLFCERISDARAFFSDLIEEAIVSHAEKQKQLVTTGILRSVSWQMK
ncbi:MAG: ATP-grasp domain-containing protein [Clostridia bacterium]|nr:ATP-grasp domain-containing protein [Clostridia bacterium]